MTQTVPPSAHSGWIAPVAAAVDHRPRHARSSQSIAGIQVMRGVAALTVVLHHSLLLAEELSSHALGALQHHLIRVGAAGVDMFFVISGFIMIYVSRHRFGTPGAAGDFLAKRVIRIAPLYWILSTALLALWLPGLILRRMHFSTADIVCSYLFVPCVQPHGMAQTTHPLLDQGWTLCYEWYFYLLFACWLAVGTLRSMLVGVPLFFGAVIALVSLSSLQGPVALFLSDPVVLEFCFGLLIGFIYLKGLRPPAAVGALLMVIGAVLLLALPLPGSDLRWLAWGGPAALIILGVLYVPAPRSMAGRALVGLGDASYSLYLCHGAVMMAVAHYLSEHEGVSSALERWTYVILMCLLSLLGGILVHRMLERPVTQFLQSRYARRRAVPTA